jgi:hypothetical protein
MHLRKEGQVVLAVYVDDFCLCCFYQANVSPARLVTQNLAWRSWGEIFVIFSVIQDLGS